MHHDAIACQSQSRRYHELTSAPKWGAYLLGIYLFELAFVFPFRALIQWRSAVVVGGTTPHAREKRK